MERTNINNDNATSQFGDVSNNEPLIVPESLERIVHELEDRRGGGEEEAISDAVGSKKNNDVNNVTTQLKNTGLKGMEKKQKKQVEENEDDRKPAAAAEEEKAVVKNTTTSNTTRVEKPVSSSSSSSSTASTTEVAAAIPPTRYDDPITGAVRQAITTVASSSSSSSSLAAATTASSSTTATSTTPSVHRHRPVPKSVGRDALSRIRGTTEGVKAAAAAVRACTNEVTLEVTEDGFIIKDSHTEEVMQVIKNKDHKKNRITMNEDGTITITDNDQDVELLQKDAIEKLYHQSGVYECWNKGCTNQETKQNKFQECARCNNARYCSRHCQVEDWHAYHKTRCKPITSKGNLKNLTLSGSPTQRIHQFNDKYNILLAKITIDTLIDGFDLPQDYHQFLTHACVIWLEDYVPPSTTTTASSKNKKKQKGHGKHKKNPKFQIVNAVATRWEDLPPRFHSVSIDHVKKIEPPSARKEKPVAYQILAYRKGNVMETNARTLNHASFVQELTPFTLKYPVKDDQRGLLLARVDTFVKTVNAMALGEAKELKKASKPKKK